MRNLDALHAAVNRRRTGPVGARAGTNLLGSVPYIQGGKFHAPIGIWIARGGLHTEYDYVIISFPRAADRRLVDGEPRVGAGVPGFSKVVSAGFALRAGLEGGR